MNKSPFYPHTESHIIRLFAIVFLVAQWRGISPVQAKQLGTQNSAAAASPLISGCPMFPADNIWNTPIDSLPVHARSDQWVNTIGRTTGFHMDFGSGTWDGGPIGIPYNIAGSSTPKVTVSFYYPDESDAGPYPIPTSPLIEYGSDHHILIVDNSDCRLYELFDASYSGGGWHAGSGAIWNLNSDALRPDTWTSADAAGLPILPGLVRYDEIVAGEINHAIRFTAQNTNGYIWPARHLTSNNPNAPQIPPMGARFRLKASYNISSYPPAMQVILRAMKTYGIILADNGSNWYVSGAPDARWNNDMLHLLDSITGNDFEAVDESGLMIDYDSGATGFTISGTVGVAGATLSYTDGTAKTITSQPDGSYSLPVSNHWAGTVTPTHTCYTFNPANQSFSNVSANVTNANFSATFNPVSGCANVNVTIGGISKGSYGVPWNPSLILNYPSTLNGPLKAISATGNKILASQRAVYGSSFNELMGYPANKFATEYWFPWYDGIYMKTWILVGNPSATQHAYVDIYIGGVKVNDTNGGVPYDIPPGDRVTPLFPGLLNGPVRVVSVTGGSTLTPINIFASERSTYLGSFNEVMGVPVDQFTTEYWFPWYDGVYMNTWILVGNPSATQHAYVDIYIGGVKKNDTVGGIPYDIPPSGNVTPMFKGELNGPVRVVSVTGLGTPTPLNIFSSERSTYGTSFNEVMGVPLNQFTTEYWFTWVDQFNTNNMKTWILVGNPSSSQDAYVDIYIAGVKQPGSPFTVPANGNITPTFTVSNGPVRVVSVTGTGTPTPIKIFTSERTLYGPSFNEVMGYPANQLTTEYWFPWYDSIYMNTDIYISKP